MELKLKLRTAIAIVVVASAISFFPTIHADFTNWDDNVYVTDNPLIKNFSLGNLANIFLTFHRGLYKPLVLVSFALDYKFFGLNPIAFHTVNLIFHLINCCLVMWLAMLLTRGKTEIAFFVALFFGIHPMHVESVAWVAERKDLLYTMGFLGAMIAYVKYRDTGSLRMYVGSALLLVLSLMVKPQGFMLPAALLLVDYYQRRQWDKKAFIDKIPHAAVALFFFVLALFSMTKNNVFFNRPFTRLDNACVAFYGILCYIKRFFLPTGLSAVYPYPQKINGHLPLMFMVAPLLALAIIGAALWLLRKNRTAVFGILFFLATLAPGLQFMPIAPSVAFDHYSYLSYFGLLMIAGELFWIFESKESTRKAAWVVLCALALVAGCMAHARAKVWTSSLTFWADDLQKYPDDTIALHNRAEIYMRLGEISKGMDDLGRAIKLASSDADNYLLFSMIYQAPDSMKDVVDKPDADRDSRMEHMFRAADLMAKSNYADAIGEYRKVLASDPTQPGVYNNLAACLYKTGDAKNAIMAYSIALHLDPQYNDAWFNRGSICLATGDYACAASDMTHAIQLDKNNWDARLKRGMALLQTGNGDAALQDFDAALSLKPDNPEILFNRGFLLMRQGKTAQALADLSAALKLRKNYPQALLTRASVYYMTKNTAAALQDMNSFIKSNPPSAQAYNNRGLILAARGDYAAAKTDYSAALALNPDYIQALVSRADATLKTGGCAAAMPDLQKALSIHNNLPLPGELAKCMESPSIH